MELFLPEAHALIDYTDTRFLSQELITDITAGERHYVDILAEIKIKGEGGYVLVHVEPQAYREADFARRMFIYFSRLYEKHQKKVLPIAVFSYDSKVSEPGRHEVAFPFLKVLQFEFYKIQLKQIPARRPAALSASGPPGSDRTNGIITLKYVPLNPVPHCATLHCGEKQAKENTWIYFLIRSFFISPKIT